MHNILILAAETIATFTVVTIIARRSGIKGLAAWIPLAMLLANVTVAKTVEYGPITASLGNVLFASTFLATDIITERYGAKTARRTILNSVALLVIGIAALQVALAYTPAQDDFAHAPMRELFTLALRMTTASIFCLTVANLLDIWLFDKLKHATAGKHLWLRNNTATILANGSENFLFATLAFAGLMPWNIVLQIAISTTIIETLIAFADTPFLYAALANTKDSQHERQPANA